VSHVKHFNVAANHPGQNGFAYVHDFLSCFAANRAEVYKMGVEVSASGALDGVRLKVLAEQQGLHFPQFERAQDAPQSGDAAGMAARLAYGLGYEFPAAIILPLLHDL